MDRSNAILQRLLNLHPREIDLSLVRIEELMASLGHPERRLPPTIHVAGTNGKGSTTAFMRAMLEAAGKRVHVYTSPHLVRFHERIRLASPDGGGFVDEDELAEALIQVEKINDGRPITQFEITTAAAFELFARIPADILLLEVGLGGRLDATNVVTAPLATVITPIAIDHEKFLGNTIEAIAFEKAGILKRDRPAIIAPQSPAALAVIDKQAALKGAKLFVSKRDWIVHSENGRLVFQDEDGLLDLPSPRLAGRHQFANAGTAIATLRQAGLQVPTPALEAGLINVEWPARLQRMTSGTLGARAGADAEIWLDSGHNPSAGIAIAEAMADLEERATRPLFLISAMLTSKEPIGFFRPFAGLVRKVYTVPVPSSTASRDPSELAKAATTAGLSAEPVANVETAIEQIATDLQDAGPCRILICGSLYLAGSVLAANGTPPR